MSLWAILSSILPITGLATLLAAIYFARKAAASKVLLEESKKLRLELLERLMASQAETKLAQAQINHMSEIYKVMDARRAEAERRASEVQFATAELVRQAAANPDADAAAREMAEKLKELLYGRA